MGRRRTRGEGAGEGMPPWLMTYGDMITLIFTFFVLLVSMGKFDASRTLATMGSVTGTMGSLEADPGLLAPGQTRRAVEPGALEGLADYEALRRQLWDNSGDIRFESNRATDIMSVNADLLFAPGRADLAETGKAFLRTALPYFRSVQHPILLAGHTAPGLDEGGYAGLLAEGRNPDPSWRLSAERCLTVYRFLLQQGVPASKLRMEAHGRFTPRYSLSEEGERRKNRRVDFVVDKRRALETPVLLRQSQLPEEKPAADRYEFQGFLFDVDRNATPPRTPGRRP